MLQLPQVPAQTSSKVKQVPVHLPGIQRSITFLKTFESLVWDCKVGDNRVFHYGEQRPHNLYLLYAIKRKREHERLPYECFDMTPAAGNQLYFQMIFERPVNGCFVRHAAHASMS